MADSAYLGIMLLFLARGIAAEGGWLAFDLMIDEAAAELDTYLRLTFFLCSTGSPDILKAVVLKMKCPEVCVWVVGIGRGRWCCSCWGVCRVRQGLGKCRKDGKW